MRSIKRLQRLVRLVAVGLVVAALVQEAARPRAERTWRGRVLGFVPYDFTLPTWERVRQAYWNAEDSRLFSDRVVGVGWAINLHRARALLSVLFGRLVGEGTSTQPIRLRRLK